MSEELIEQLDELYRKKEWEAFTLLFLNLYYHLGSLEIHQLMMIRLLLKRWRTNELLELIADRL